MEQNRRLLTCCVSERGLPPTDSPLRPASGRTPSRGFLWVSDTFVASRPDLLNLRYTPGLTTILVRLERWSATAYSPRWAIASWRAAGAMRKTPV
jgi:hypothetical protein